jgi:Family of unknown function (DUF5681)
MSKSNEKDKARKSNSAPAAPYKVGNKKPPLQTQFKPGQSGNPSGRPKGRSNFGTILLKEIHKTIPATINGKSVKVTKKEAFARALVMDGITKGPQSKTLLLNFLNQQEAHEAAEAEAKKKAAAEEPVQKFSWTEEQEKLFRELASANGFEVPES